MGGPLGILGRGSSGGGGGADPHKIHAEWNLKKIMKAIREYIEKFLHASTS